MPRNSRKKSCMKVYHIIVRGINKQDIFLDKQDYVKFTKELIRAKKKYLFKIYAYVLMKNHVHLLIKDENDKLSSIMQSINISYSLYFNKKYERVGHLFENRFKSQIVENEKYLKNVIRYIHKNPEKAGIKKHYPWTSYYQYTTKNKNTLIEKNFILSLFGNDINNFKVFHNKYSLKDDLNEKYEMINKIEDEIAIKIMKEISNEENLLKIQKYNIEKKYEIVMKFIKIEGIKKVQIARILGMNKKTIERIEKKMSL